MKRERKQFRRIVFLDPQAAFGLPELPWWSCHSRRDEHELATELDKRPRDWTHEEYYYVPLIEKIPGYRQVFDAAANRWDAALQKQQGVPRLPASCRTDELQCFRAECVPALYRRWRDPEFCGISRH